MYMCMEQDRNENAFINKYEKGEVTKRDFINFFNSQNDQQNVRNGPNKQIKKKESDQGVKMKL